MRKNTRWGFTLVAALLLFSMMAGMAQAHVVVYPREAHQGTYEKFAVRVPTEIEAPTVQVRVEIPEDVDITRFEPKYGWSYELERDDSEKIIAVTWNAEGEGLSATEFGEFYMQGRIGNEAGDLVWNAIQTYADGTVVEWTGPVDADRPASVTKVHESAVAVDGHGHGAAADDNGAGTGWLQWLTLALSIGALLLSFMAMRRAQQR
ncbi:DUF1775 domain-containing protein [Xylanibacillus composti]|nr:YcnI family protein [Xylanibacillus composti]MDT9723990.1 DUF1775 domain-containing protein [Xylanibacillus composti]